MPCFPFTNSDTNEFAFINNINHVIVIKGKTKIKHPADQSLESKEDGCDINKEKSHQSPLIMEKIGETLN